MSIMEYSVRLFQRMCKNELDIRANGPTASRLIARAYYKLELGDVEAAAEAAIDAGSCRVDDVIADEVVHVLSLCDERLKTQ